MCSYINACVFWYVSVTGGCSGGELWVKVESVFRSSNRRLERRPHLLPVQLLQKTMTFINIGIDQQQLAETQN